MPPPRPVLHAMFDSDAGLRDAALAAGFAGAEVSEAVVRSRFRDVSHLYDWIGSHGGRQVVARIPPARRGDAEAALAGELELERDRPLEFTTRFRVLAAQAAG
jgi:hypothetical protein